MKQSHITTHNIFIYGDFQKKSTLYRKLETCLIVQKMDDLIEYDTKSKYIDYIAILMIPTLQYFVDDCLCQSLFKKENILTFDLDKHCPTE